MKLVLFVAAVVVLVWLLRGAIGRRSDGSGEAQRRAAGKAPDGPQPMLRCAQCGLHLPRDEALPGRGGVFCCDAHRADYERVHAGS